MTSDQDPPKSAADALRRGMEHKPALLSGRSQTQSELETEWLEFVAALPRKPNSEDDALIEGIGRLEIEADDNRKAIAIAEAKAREAEALAKVESEKTTQEKIALADRMVSAAPAPLALPAVPMLQAQPKKTKRGRKPKDNAELLRWIQERKFKNSKKVGVRELAKNIERELKTGPKHLRSVTASRIERALKGAVMVSLTIDEEPFLKVEMP